jgi:hypothetical protein
VRTVRSVQPTVTSNSIVTYRTVRYRTVRFRRELFVTQNSDRKFAHL